MSKEHLSRDELEALFRVGHFVDIYKATGLLAASITAELKPVTASFINATWGTVIEPDDYDNATQQGELILFPIPTLFARYADFMVALGEDLGIARTNDDAMCDDWISESMPKTRAIANALSGLAAKYLAETSAAMRAERGYSPAEVFVGALNSGESFDQTKARLGHSAKGLSAVESKSEGSS